MRTDWISLKGADVTKSGVRDRYVDKTFAVQEHNPERVDVSAIPGNSAVHVTWIVQGDGPFTIEVNSLKGGSLSMEVSP